MQVQNNLSIFQVTSIWVLPFIYVISASYILSLAETIQLGGTFVGWWNLQRMWLIKKITSFTFATIDTMLKFFHLSKLSFSITEKVTDGDIKKRYEQGIIEFGSTSSPYLVIIASVAFLNLFCLLGGFGILLAGKEMERVDEYFLQGFLCAVLTVIHLPIYNALFVRKDNGSFPFSVLITSLSFAMFVVLFTFPLSEVNSALSQPDY
jgi:hypothetical protein